jgi:hypothetical protein
VRGDVESVREERVVREMGKVSREEEEEWRKRDAHSGRG